MEVGDVLEEEALGSSFEMLFYRLFLLKAQLCIEEIFLFHSFQLYLLLNMQTENKKNQYLFGRGKFFTPLKSPVFRMFQIHCTPSNPAQISVYRPTFKVTFGLFEYCP